MGAETGASSARRTVAVLVILLGTAGLWWFGRSGVRGAEAWNATSQAIAEQQKENAGANDARLKGAERFEEGGWIYVHLEGDPASIGFQHGYLLGPEIEDGFA
ncbi:MAG: hypothetical protein WCE50_03070, partial [Candidatus Acidiferrum sp.]